MFLEDYPYDPNIKIADSIYHKKFKVSGTVVEIFGKKCSVWLDGRPLYMHTKKVTFHQKDLVKSGHIDYELNVNSFDEYFKLKLKKGYK